MPFLAETGARQDYFYIRCLTQTFLKTLTNLMGFF